MANHTKGPWHDVVDKVAKRFELAAMFNSNTVHNPKGSAAVAKLLRTMARVLDQEIEARTHKTNLTEGLPFFEKHKPGNHEG